MDHQAAILPAPGGIDGLTAPRHPEHHQLDGPRHRRTDHRGKRFIPRQSSPHQAASMDSLAILPAASDSSRGIDGLTAPRHRRTHCTAASRTPSAGRTTRRQSTFAAVGNIFCCRLCHWYPTTPAGRGPLRPATSASISTRPAGQARARDGAGRSRARGVWSFRSWKRNAISQELVDLDVLPTGELQQPQTLVSGVLSDGGDPQVGDRLGGRCYENAVFDLFCHVS